MYRDSALIWSRFVDSIYDTVEEEPCEVCGGLQWIEGTEPFDALVCPRCETSQSMSTLIETRWRKGEWVASESFKMADAMIAEMRRRQREK